MPYLRNILVRLNLTSRFAARPTSSMARNFPALQSAVFDSVKRSQGHFLDHAVLKRLCEEYYQLDQENKLKFFVGVASELGVEHSEVEEVLEKHKSSSKDVALSRLSLYSGLRAALEPAYLRVFQHILSGPPPAGLQFLIDMRADLLDAIKQRPDPVLRDLSETMRQNFASWLAVGFLKLHQITWNSPASIIEKIVRYEAVHPVTSIADLKQRLGAGRRVYAFFHPNLPAQPLVFIQVAFLQEIASAMSDILQSIPADAEAKANTAIFYSITSSQKGLQGVDLGHLLIKRVVSNLKEELPHIQQFSTLSPIPGFSNWLSSRLEQATHTPLLPAERQHISRLWQTDDAESALLTFVRSFSHFSSHPSLSASFSPSASAPPPPGARSLEARDIEILTDLQPTLMRLCAQYLYHEKNKSYALDPVANFHLRNGAILFRINWMGDRSSKGLRQSLGMMVNYKYVLEQTEQNHTAYTQDFEITCSDQVKALLPRDMEAKL